MYLHRNRKRKSSNEQQALSLTTLKAPLAVLSARWNHSWTQKEQGYTKAYTLIHLGNSYIRARTNDPYLCRRFYVPCNHRACCLRLLRRPFLALLPPSFLFRIIKRPALRFYGRRISMTGLKEDACTGNGRKGPAPWQSPGYKNLRKVVPLMGTSGANRSLNTAQSFIYQRLKPRFFSSKLKMFWC